MTIDEKTRKRRVKEWNARKTAWVAKLEAAKNPNDKAVAEAMIAEAEGVLKRLETKDEVDQDVATPTKTESTSNTKKKTAASGISKEKASGTIGL